MKEDRERRYLLSRYKASGASRDALNAARKLSTKQLRHTVQLMEKGAGGGAPPETTFTA